MPDPKIRFDIEAATSGEADVNRLADSLERLDGSIDPALAQTARELATELRGIGQQQEAVSQFVALKTRSAEAAAELAKAQQEAQAYAQEIGQAGEATKAQTGRLEKLRDAVRDAKTQEQAATLALQAQREVLSANGIAADGLASKTRELAQRQAEAVQGVKQLRAAQEAAEQSRSSIAQAVAASNARAVQMAQQAQAARAAEAAQAKEAQRQAEAAALAQRLEDEALLARSREIAQQYPRLAAAAATAGAKQEKAATGVRGQLAGLAAQLGGLPQLLAAAFSMRELIDAAARMEQLRVGLEAVSGDAGQAGRDLEFVRDVANRVGLSVTDAGQAFLSLSAATKGTAVEGQATQQVFEAVATAMAKAGKSSAETDRALQALSQMASKGQVQMEELRGQLGEALPGALQAAAKGLGITTQDLIALVEQGQIAASDLFPALSKGLNDLYGTAPAAQTLSQEITNIGNAVKQMGEDLGNSGGLDALKTGAEVTQTAIVALDVGLVTLGQTIGVLAAAVTSLDFSGIPEAFRQIEAEARDKLVKAAEHNEVLRHYIEAVGTEAQKTALAQADQAKAAQQAAAAADVQTSALTQLSIAYGKQIKAIQDSIDQAERSRQAREAEGKASVALADALGTEAERRIAHAAAARQDADQTAEVARLKLTEVAALKAQLEAMQKATEEEGKANEQTTKRMADLQKQIEARQADADKSVAQAQASRLLAEQTLAEAEAYRDNSGRVKELGQAYEDAKARAEGFRQAMLLGAATQQQVSAAEAEAARAARVYRDALDDQVRAIEAKARAQQAGYSLQEAELRLAIQQQQAALEVAQARGDESGVIRAQNELRQLEIKLLELQAQAKAAEAKAELAAVEAKKAALLASGELTDQMKLELDAATAAAKVKQVEAEMASTTAQKLRDLEDAQRNSRKASDDAATGYGAETDALGGLNSTLERTLDLKNSLRNVDEQGFARDMTGKQTINAEGATYASLVAVLKNYGLEDAAAQQVARQFVDGTGNVPAANNPGQRIYGGASLSDALQRAAQQALYGADASGAKQGGKTPSSTNSSSGSGTSSTTSPAATSSTTHTVVLKLGNKSTTINTASEADSRAMVAFLSQLEADAARASV